MPRWNPVDGLEALVPRVYAYAAYRVGGGSAAEDITHDTFERALRYRDTFDGSRGDLLPWLIGIARRCIFDAARSDSEATLMANLPDETGPGELESDAIQRLDLAAALAKLSAHDRELVALRYGGDLTAREIGELLGMRTNAVEVALHRALAKLRALLQSGPTELEVDRGSPPRSRHSHA